MLVVQWDGRGERGINVKQKVNEKIALWLGFSEHSHVHSKWDFHASPAHYERIKIKMRTLGIKYRLDYAPDLPDYCKFNLAYCNGFAGEVCGASEGDVLVQAALAIIKQG